MSQRRQLPDDIKKSREINRGIGCTELNQKKGAVQLRL